MNLSKIYEEMEETRLNNLINTTNNTTKKLTEKEWIKKYFSDKNSWMGWDDKLLQGAVSTDDLINSELKSLINQFFNSFKMVNSKFKKFGYKR